jgi:SagB-type dehydrogenase family enzyme
VQLLQRPDQTSHQATEHSYASVMMDPNYVDPSSQPAPFKRYPSFYRRFPLKLDHPIATLIHLASAITYEKAYKDGPYQLRVNPSAGALYPTELYVQLRGVTGWIDGIYHVEIATQSLTLIYELIDDGLEAYITPNQLVKGIIFLVSCVYYRSSWKYKNRSLRYCFLDSGHHVGAIEAAAYTQNHPIQVLFEFDKVPLNQDMGFENKELSAVCAIAGELKNRPVRRLRSPLPFVSGTDYFEANPWVEAAYHETLFPASPVQQLQHPQFPFEPSHLSEAILQRRSARQFYKQAIAQDVFWQIVDLLEQPIPTIHHEQLDIYWVIHRVNGLEPGIYYQRQQLKPGDFTDKTGYLCINQAIARDSAVTLFITSAYQNYQTALQQAGLLGHRVYLASQYWNLGCTGIGAYYDRETQDFLGTDDAVVYALAIGPPPLCQ